MPPEYVGKAEQPIGAAVPDFSLHPVDGTETVWRLHEMAAQGQGAVVVFWSAVCSHCVRYDAYFNSFAKRHPAFAFVAVASRQDEAAEDIRRAVAARDLTFPILHDPDRLVARLLFVRQTPRVFVVDRLSRLQYRGAIDNFKYPEDPEYESYLEPAISSVMVGQAVTRPETPSFGCAIETVYYVIPKPFKRG
jgi:peroxiredoxin